MPGLPIGFPVDLVLVGSYRVPEFFGHPFNKLKNHDFSVSLAKSANGC